MSLLCVTAPAEAKEEAYYTWVDEQGVTNYSERDPKDQNAIYVTPSSRRFGYLSLPEKEPEPEQANLSTDQTPSTSGGDAESQDPDTQLQIEKDRIQQEIAKVKASNCQVGRRNLARLEAYARIRMKEADGTERILTDEEKQQKIDDAKKTISENCTNS